MIMILLVVDGKPFCKLNPHFEIMEILSMIIYIVQTKDFHLMATGSFFAGLGLAK